LITTFLYNLSIGLFSIFITYITGKIITSSFSGKTNNFFHLFTSLLLGLVVISTSFAIYKSGGKTIMLLIIPMGTILFFYYKKQIKQPTFKLHEIKQDILYLLLLFTIIQMYQNWFFFDYSNNTIKSIYTDTYWYSTFCDSQKNWGIENYFRSFSYFFRKEEVGLVPYHYPELWLTALFSILFKIGTIQSMYLIVYPILICSFLIGIISVFEKILTNRIVLIIISILLLFTSGTTCSWYNSIHILQYSHTIADISLMGLFGTKYTFVYPFLLLGFMLLFQNKQILSFFILSAIPIFSVSFLPPIWGGLICYALFSFLFLKQIDKRTILITIGIILLNLILFLFFYNRFKSTFSNDFAINFIIDRYYKNGHFIFLNIKAFVGNTLFYVLKIVIIYFPIIIIGIFTWIEINKILILIFIMIGLGIITSSFFLGFTDGNQFANNILICASIVQILGLSILIKQYTNSPNKRYFILIALILIGIFYSIYWDIQRKNIGTRWYKEDKDFIKKTNNLITESKSCVMVFLDENGFANNTFLGWHAHNDFYLATQFDSKEIVFAIGNPELFLKVNNSLSAVDSFEYYNLTPINIWKRKKENTLKSFIKQFHIRYFYFKAGVEIPPFIQKQSKQVEISKQSGSIFYKL